MTGQEKNNDIQKPSVMASEMGINAKADELGLGDFLGHLQAGKWVVVAVATCVLALAILYVLFAKPVYEADSLIQIQQQSATNPLASSSGGSANALAALFPEAANTDAEIQIMTSRSVLEPVIREKQLDIEINPPTIPFIGSLFGSSSSPDIKISKLKVPANWYDEKMQLRIGADDAYSLYSPSGDEVLKGKLGAEGKALGGRLDVLVASTEAKPGYTYTLVRLSEEEAITNVLDNLNVQETVKDTGIVQLTYDSRYPSRAKSIVNAIAAQYIRQNVESMALQAQKSLGFVEKELPNLKSKLDHAQSELAQFQSTHEAVALDQQAQALLAQLSTYETQLTQIELVKQAQKHRYTNNFPEVQSLSSQENAIKGKIQGIKNEIQALPKEEQGYLTLSENVQVYQQLYAGILAQAQNLQIAQAGTVGSARIVDRAITPIKPVRPRVLLIIVTGIIFGVLLGIFVVFFRRALKKGIEDPNVLEQTFGLPTVAVIPHSELQKSPILKTKNADKEKFRIIAAEATESVSVEALRSLKTSIGFAMLGADKKIITFGGTAPGVGKSFVSVNVAHLTGMSGSRTLVIDADMRRGHLQRYFGAHRSPGLSEFLLGKVGFSEAIRTSPNCDNLDFISSGYYPSNPLELSSSDRMAELVERAAAEYEYVIIDVPPILAVADAMSIGRIATANYLVVKAHSQPIREIDFAIRRLNQNGVKLQGFVFNDVPNQSVKNASRRFGYVYQYRYDKSK